MRLDSAPLDSSRSLLMNSSLFHHSKMASLIKVPAFSLKGFTCKVAHSMALNCQIFVANLLRLSHCPHATSLGSQTNTKSPTQLIRVSRHQFTMALTVRDFSARSRWPMVEALPTASSLVLRSCSTALSDYITVSYIISF